MANDGSISRFLRSRRLRGRAAPGPSAPFVVGVGRSGTTLLRLMLDAHPQMAMPPETHFFESVLAASGRLRFGPEQALLAIREDPRRRWNDFGITEDELLDRFEAIEPFNVSDALRAFYALYAEKQGKPRWGDKTPTYVKTMRRIQRALPEARFIHVIRDGRDVTLSNNKRMLERGHRDPLPAETSAARWRKRIETARADSAHLDAYLEIRYEDLVADTEPALRRVCDYLELDFDPVM
ncbi:MAG: sulfotransferase, partial [Actinomycetota bacterium]|nr:sulfotransferase [Actinomycetota bacterium]